MSIRTVATMKVHDYDRMTESVTEGLVSSHAGMRAAGEPGGIPDASDLSTMLSDLTVSQISSSPTIES